MCEEFGEVDGVEWVCLSGFVCGEEEFGVFEDAEVGESALDCLVVWAGVGGVVCGGFDDVERFGVFLEVVDRMSGVEVVG